LSIGRDTAIAKLADVRLRTLDKERWDLLLENVDVPDVGLPPELLRQVKAGDIEDRHDPRLDPLLIARLSERLHTYTNRYLKECLSTECQQEEEVTGLYLPLPATCPCCGAASLHEQGCWDICNVCWWEDDGQDGNAADEVWGGPNAGQSLSSARLNYLKHGIFDPTREDLRAYQVPRYAYAERRRFVLSEDQARAIEVPCDA
jgi:hypothetical protein